VVWKGVNYDQRENWAEFEAGKRFAIVDFHFHPRAEYWFDHHPTTFLTEELRAQYSLGALALGRDVAVVSAADPAARARALGLRPPRASRRWRAGPTSIDAARYKNVEQACSARTRRCASRAH
jgi:hypothetical protein